jgi:hypothetical protein
LNRRQKLVQQRFLNNEEEVIKELKKTYTTALDDINNNIKNLNLEIDSIQGAIDVWEDFGGDEEKAILQSQLQSKIYQKQYQEALHGQIDDVLDKMNTEQFNTVSDYLKTCYDDGYIGTLYDLQGQGVPLIMPIDQESVVRAVQLDSKISGGLYNRMGEDVTGLKKVIASEVSRGIATGMTYNQVAKQISAKMVGTGYKDGGAMASAMRIARTEGHRIQCQAGMDACYKAKDMGADVLKQWDATLDARTRESHQKVDGEVRELDEKFSNGLMFPGDPSGRASEVVNCRCALLQRARWALDENELQTLKNRAEYFGLDKTETFEDFKKQYLKAVEPEKASKVAKSIFTPATSLKEAEEYASKMFGESINYNGLTVKQANELNEALFDLQQKHPTIPYKQIKTTKMKAIARASDDSLEINPSKFTYYSDSTFENLKKYDQYELANIQETLATRKMSPAMRKKLEKQAERLERNVKFERWSAVLDNPTTTVYHEYGHTLASQKFGGVTATTWNDKFGIHTEEALIAKKKRDLLEKTYETARNNGDIFAIGKYADTDADEFFAEIFAMHMKGETLPEYIEAMLTEVLI